MAAIHSAAQPRSQRSHAIHSFPILKRPPPVRSSYCVGIGDANSADTVSLSRDPCDLAEIDVERVVIEPAKLWVVVAELTVLDQRRHFLVALKLHYDGIIDNGSKTRTGLYIFLNDIAPPIGGVPICHGSFVAPRRHRSEEHDAKKYAGPSLPQECAKPNEQGGKKGDPYAVHFVFQ